MSIRKSVVLAVLLSGLLSAGCDVDQTRDGKLPDVDVEAKGGQMPAYEVETADVDVGTKRSRLNVPDIDVNSKETEVTVPDVDVKMPADDAEEEVE